MKELRTTLRVTLYGIKSNRVLWGIMLLVADLIFPVFTLLQQNEYTVLNESGMLVYGTVTAYVMGIFAPVVLFSYLHKHTEQDFYSAMPVTRTQYFVGYTLSAFIMFIVPYILMFVIHSFFSHSRDLWAAFWQPVGMFFVLYCSFTLCMMFSTSPWGTAVTIALRNGIAASLVILPFVLASFDSNAYFQLLSDKILMFTPLGTGFSLDENYSHIMPVQLVVAAAELVSAYVIYRKRKNETALALAFPKTRYLYQYAVMTVATLLISAALSTMMSVKIELTRYRAEAWLTLILLTAVLAFIIFVLLNMILEKSSKAAFRKFYHFFVFIAAFGIITYATVGWLINNLPYSTLPFTPKFAVVNVYSTKEITSEDEHYDFSVMISNAGTAYTGEYSSKNITKKYLKTFIVTDGEKLAELVRYAQRPSATNFYGNMVLLPHQRRWWDSFFVFTDDYPEETVAVSIDFYSEKPNFSDSVTAEELSKKVYDNPSLRGPYKGSTRYGLAKNEEYISGFCDTAVNTDT